MLDRGRPDLGVRQGSAREIVQVDRWHLLDVSARALICADGESLSLTIRECEVLGQLVVAAGELWPSYRIARGIARAGGYPLSMNSVKQTIYRLRAKLERIDHPLTVDGRSGGYGLRAMQMRAADQGSEKRRPQLSDGIG